MSWRPLASIAALTERAHLLALTRQFFAERGVLEVQTPLLGAATVTEPDIDAIAVPGHGFLQTSPEYFMKRLLAAGMPSCYQLASVFRGNERGRRHNPEFTMLEWYRLGFDQQQLQSEVAALCDLLLGADDYQTISYADLAGDLGRPRDQLDLAVTEACDALGAGRFFVTDYPADQAVLARLRPDDPRWAARFELIIDGVEVANGYHELLDADEHRRRFDQDQAVRRDRGLSVPDVDQQLLAALQHGLPDCAGVAVGFDRLVMLKLGATSLDEVLAFRG